MKRYEIPCTAEQTRKAFELGAPIEFEMECPVNLDTLERSPYPDIKMGKDGESLLIAPTAEEMIGWLEEQGFYFYIYKDDLWNGEVEYGYKWYGSSYDVSSRETATLAVIDAALDHLTKIKK